MAGICFSRNGVFSDHLLCESFRNRSIVWLAKPPPSRSCFGCLMNQFSFYTLDNISFYGHNFP